MPILLRYSTPPHWTQIHTAKAPGKNLGNLTVYGGYHGPNTLITQIHTQKETGWFHQYFFEQPIDEFQTRIYFVNMRNWLMDEAMDETIMERNLVIAHQDIHVMNNLRPFVTPASMTKEILLPADAIIGKYRSTLKEFDKKWDLSIDVRTLKNQEHQYCLCDSLAQLDEQKKTGFWTQYRCWHQD